MRIVPCLFCAVGALFLIATGTPGQELAADFNRDFVVDWWDFLIFTEHWLSEECDEANTWCEGTDITTDGTVAWDDFGVLAGEWDSGGCFDLPPEDRTLQCPGSWLVLFNANNPDSVQWVQWYAAQRSIPGENLLGLDIPPGTAEQVGDDGVGFYEQYVRGPVLSHLADHQALDERIMGILVGYAVPGSFTWQGNPMNTGGGGYSITSALQMPARDYRATIPSPLYPNPFYDLQTPLTKSILNTHPGIYVTARIDAPTLADAQALTTRAKEIELLPWLPDTQRWWYDHIAESFGGYSWYDLLQAVQTDYPTLAWSPFSCESTAVSAAPVDDAFRIGWYRLTGWNTAATLAGTPEGLRIFAYNLNSFGCTTLRSTDAHSGRFAPNVLFRAGYASAGGATSEPGGSPSDPGWHEPSPRILVNAISHPKPVVEAYFTACRRICWMWEWVGDPFLLARINVED